MSIIIATQQQTDEGSHLEDNRGFEFFSSANAVLKQDELRREIFPIRAIPYLPKKLSLKIQGRDSISNR